MSKIALLRLETTNLAIINDRNYFGCVCLPDQYSVDDLSQYFGRIYNRSFSIIGVPEFGCYVFIDNETSKYLCLDDFLLDDNFRKEFESASISFCEFKDLEY